MDRKIGLRLFERCPVVMQGPMRGATVLVVEDDADTRNVYTLGLGHIGYRVVTAESGIEGLRAARDEHPDVILLDLSLSGADGWEVVRCLKASNATRDIPVLLITGHANLEGRARDEGCDGYLMKPLPLDALRDAVASAVRRRGASPGARPGERPGFA